MNCVMSFNNSPRLMSMRWHSQRGISLVMVLLILVVVSILGVGGAQLVLMNEKSARYDRDYQIAWEAAEAALQDAEFDIRGPNISSAQRMTAFSAENQSAFVEGCGNDGHTRGLCLPVDSGKPVWAKIDFSDESGAAKSVAYGTFTGRSMTVGNGIQPARLPRYVIEVFDYPEGERKLDPSGQLAKGKLYRVTAMGFGPQADTQVVMQMEFRKEL